MYRSILLLTSILLCLASAQAKSQINVKLGKPAQQQSMCVHYSLFRTFRALSSRHILLQYDNKNYYLMTMRRTCFGLNTSYSIYPRFQGQVCSNRRDEIAYEDKLGEVDYCELDTIDHVESAKAAKSLIAQRKEDRSKKKDE